jgi:hypothetical protein
MDPDKLCEGCKDFFKEGLDYVVFEFVCLYLRRIKTDVVWKKLLRENTGDPIFKFITPSDIAYILSIMKNGKEMWDQKKRLEGTGGTSHEEKIGPLFSVGEGRKRMSGQTVWNSEGLDFFYDTKKKWEEIYNTKMYSRLVKKWEEYEGEGKTRAIKGEILRTIDKYEGDKVSKKRGIGDEISPSKGKWYNDQIGKYTDDVSYEMKMDYSSDDSDKQNDRDGNNNDNGNGNEKIGQEEKEEQNEDDGEDERTKKKAGKRGAGRGGNRRGVPTKVGKESTSSMTAREQV